MTSKFIHLFHLFVHLYYCTLYTLEHIQQFHIHLFQVSVARVSSRSKTATGTTTASSARSARPLSWAKVSSPTDRTSSAPNAQSRSSCKYTRSLLTGCIRWCDSRIQCCLILLSHSLKLNRADIIAVLFISVF